jgi:hypothetical protein
VDQPFVFIFLCVSASCAYSLILILLYISMEELPLLHTSFLYIVARWG